MKDTIVDNAPEMELGGPEFTEMLSKVSPKTEVEEPVKQGEKEKVALSPEATKEPEQGEQEVDTPEALKAQIRGLKAELTRRAGNADKVGELEAQLQNLQGQLQALSAKPKETDELAERIQKLDDKEIYSKISDWQAELSIASSKYERAEESGDEAKIGQAYQRIVNAKRMLSAFNEERDARAERKTKQAEELRTEAEQINDELNSMYEVVNEAFPDFQNPESELWKAGNEVYVQNPALMARMGPSGEILAAALAILRNPDLVGKGKGAAAARRDVISKLDKGLSKALSAGASSPSTARNVDYGKAVASGEDLAKFNSMVDSIKGG